MIVQVPNVVFKLRVRDENSTEQNPFKWEHVNSHELFQGRRVLIFSLPGAFTPTCSTFQLPNFEKLYDSFKDHIDEIYCMSVNDAFVMNAWGKQQELRNVKLLPDGSGEFTRKMGMLVDKDNLGFGMRSWRYAVLVNNLEVEQAWIEPGFCDNAEDDPYGETDPYKILDDIRS